MPRRKTIHIANPSRVADLCKFYKCDPFEEMLKMAMESNNLPEDCPEEALKAMCQRYDVYEENGRRKFRLKGMDRFDVLKECAQYVYPRLRSSETKEEKDFKLTVLIQSYDKTQEAKIINVVPMKELADGK